LDSSAVAEEEDDESKLSLLSSLLSPSWLLSLSLLLLLLSLSLSSPLDGASVAVVVVVVVVLAVSGFAAAAAVVLVTEEEGVVELLAVVEVVVVVVVSMVLMVAARVLLPMIKSCLVATSCRVVLVSIIMKEYQQLSWSVIRGWSISITRSRSNDEVMVGIMRCCSNQWSYFLSTTN